MDLTDPNAAQVAAALPPVILPHLVQALAAELPRYSAGGAWNSCLRLGSEGRGLEMALFVTEPRRFGQPQRGALPPRVLLDATADEDLLARLFDAPVEVLRAEVPPPPNTRHIAVRTGKRYGKTSLTARHGRDLSRAIAECRYLLHDLDPDGAECAAGRVGLITHKDCEQAMAEALGIAEQRRGHFWGMRGSNRLEDCTLLLLVGTPAVRPEQVARLARAFYRDDPEPLDETAAPDDEGRWRYRDTRMQRVCHALVRAELTQCAHRNRPLRYDGRVVVTLCAGEILDLPATTEITSLPQLTAEGLPRAQVQQQAQDSRLERAADALTTRGEALTARALAAEAKISLNVACAWLRRLRTGTPDTEALLSPTQEALSCTPDNTATMPAAAATAGASPDGPTTDETLEPTPAALAPVPFVLSMTPTGVCPAASHQLLWHWTAGTWQCPLCGTARPLAPGASFQHHEGRHP